MSTSPASRARRAPFLGSPILGSDAVFVHEPADAAYATALARALTSEGFTVAKRARARRPGLLVVITPRHEPGREFTQALERLVAPNRAAVVVSETFAIDGQWAKALLGPAPIVEQSVAFYAQTPSRDTIARLLEIGHYGRSNARAARLRALSLVTALPLAGGATWATNTATQARANLIDAETEARSVEAEMNSQRDETRRVEEALLAAETTLREENDAARRATADAKKSEELSGAIRRILRPDPPIPPNGFDSTVTFSRSHSHLYAKTDCYEITPNTNEQDPPLDIVLFHAVGVYGSNFIQAGQPQDGMRFFYEGEDCYKDIRVLLAYADGSFKIAKTTACDSEALARKPAETACRR